MRAGSVRLRVAVGVSILLAVVVVATCLVLNTVLADRLRSDQRDRLTERANFAAVLAVRTSDPQQLADDLTGQGITATVFSNGEPVVGRNSPRTGRQGGPPVRPVQSSAAGVSVQQTGTTLTARVQLGNGDSILLSTDTIDITRTLSTLRTIELAAGAAILVIGCLACLVIVSLALRPLRRMSLLAQRVRAGDRGHRLSPTRTTTDIGRTAAAVDAMLEELEGAEASAQLAETRMREFLADASHDLRTPLASIVASAEDLLRRDPHRLERETRLVELIRTGRHAGRLVDDLLMLARLDQNTPTATLPVDLGQLAGQVVRAARMRFPQHTIELISTDQPTTLGDADRLRRALANLIDNACAADTHTRSVSVQVGADIQLGQAIIEVRDAGPGVPSDAHERIFDRFVRLDPSRSVTTDSGAGLGLPIARAVVRAHGGDVTSLPATSGGHFRVALPLAPSGVGLVGHLGERSGGVWAVGEQHLEGGLVQHGHTQR